MNRRATTDFRRDFQKRILGAVDHLTYFDLKMKTLVAAIYFWLRGPGMFYIEILLADTTVPTKYWTSTKHLFVPVFSDEGTNICSESIFQLWIYLTQVRVFFLHKYIKGTHDRVGAAHNNSTCSISETTLWIWIKFGIEEPIFKVVGKT
jgi:hypothetical protein